MMPVNTVRKQVSCSIYLIEVMLLFMVTINAEKPILPNHAQHDLVNIATYIAGIVVDLKYATADNFTREIVYNFTTCYLIEPVAQALKKAQEDLQEEGLSRGLGKLRFKVWDGLRPEYAQEKFWKICPDPRYVSPPGQQGRHTRGTAVDLTIVKEDGSELEMPSEFDDFTDRAHADYQGCSQTAKDNRALLLLVMVRNGFKPCETEWWHFDYKGWRTYPVRTDDLRER